MKHYTAFAAPNHMSYNAVQTNRNDPFITQDSWEMMNDKTSSFATAEFVNDSPAGYTVAAQKESGPSALRVHSQGQKKSKP